MDRARLASFRTLILSQAIAGYVSMLGCGRTEMGTSAVGTGGESGGGGAGGAGATLSGPCGEATCLVSLFQTCVPEGNCVISGGGSPSAAFSTSCYENGVTVSRVGSGSGTITTDKLTVHRDGRLCYSVERSSPVNASATDYAVLGPDNEKVAVGTTVDKSGHLTLTCVGGQPTTISEACLRPVGDTPACVSGICP